jgi:hypothetical protein
VKKRLWTISAMLLLACLTATAQGPAVPNPATDGSFERFMKDRAFVAALDEIRKTGRLYPDRLDFTAPAAPWVLTVAAGDFEVSESRLTPDGRQSYSLISTHPTHRPDGRIVCPR